MTTTQKRVLEFHLRFGLPAHREPTLPSLRETGLRASLIAEEEKEVQEAIASSDLEAVAQELADLVYVAYGTALAYGIDLDAAVAEVHRANMSKLGDDGHPLFRSDGKVLKGPNYRPPDMRYVLERQRGYRTDPPMPR